MAFIKEEKNGISARASKHSLPELLATAGSFDALKAAVNAGADAIYMGGDRFSARAYADNLSKDTFREALSYAHLHGRRVYLTVNTLMKEKELNQILFGFLEPYYEAGLDGVIVQDLGTASFIHDFFPDIELHASTQMTITDINGAMAAKKMHFSRIVPARELSLSEIEAIKKASGLEIEVFIHGALCYCYSGQCLLSSMCGGRSGNRGRCAQPCRLPWHLKETPEGNRKDFSQHLLSPKDLCSLSVLPSLVLSGVDSLKIEGRMKNVEYVAGVTSIYRKYLDICQKLLDTGKDLMKDYHVEKEDVHFLEELYCRDEFTEGYWHRHNGPEMISVKHPKNTGRKIGTITKVKKYQIFIELFDKIHAGDILVIPSDNAQDETILTVPGGCAGTGQITLNIPAGAPVQKGMSVYRRKNQEITREIQKTIIEKELRLPVQGSIRIMQNEAAQLTLQCDSESITLFGAAAETAAKRSVTREDVFRQMNKTGNVPFYFESLHIELEENSFIPMSKIKELRQQGFAQLLSLMEEKDNRLPVTKHPKNKETNIPSPVRKCEQARTAVVYDEKILSLCLEEEFYTGICLPADIWEQKRLLSAVREIHLAGKKAFLSLPSVERQDMNLWDSLCFSGIWEGIYVHNINEAFYLSNAPQIETNRIGGASFYQWNANSAAVSRDYFGISRFQLPFELSAEEISDMINTPSGNGFQWEWQVYGRIPLMVSAQCPKKTTGQCNHQQDIVPIQDNSGRTLYVSSHCPFCYSKIWSEKPRNLIGENASKTAGNISGFLFDFFLSKPEEIRKVKTDFLQWEANGFQKNNSGKRTDEHWNHGIR